LLQDKYRIKRVAKFLKDSQTNKMNVKNTVIVSDLHLTETKIVGPNHRSWMAYKKISTAVDLGFAKFLSHINKNVDGTIELVFNGDTFDFDLVLSTPKDISINFLSKKRGLGYEEWMSLFKINVIIDGHPVFFKALKDFIAQGHKVVIISGNHDVELYWKSVQNRLRSELDTNEQSLVFCRWFYISNNDTYISHGHQYDPNCVIRDIINPTIRVKDCPVIRVPFGNLAAKYIANGIGWLNPHSKKDCILSAKDYLRLFFRHLRSQPLMGWSWLWGSIVAFYISIEHHIKQSIKSPFSIENEILNIAKNSNTTPSVVYKLEALKVASTCTNPFTIFRELWLDRSSLLFILLFIAWQVMLHINIATHVSMLWFIIPFILLLPTLIIYSSNIKSTAFSKPLLTPERAEYIFKITGVDRIVLAHTHDSKHTNIGSIEYINSGSWAPEFSDINCKVNSNDNKYVLITNNSDNRQASLINWPL